MRGMSKSEQEALRVQRMLKKAQKAYENKINEASKIDLRIRNLKSRAAYLPEV